MVTIVYLVMLSKCYLSLRYSVTYIYICLRTIYWFISHSFWGWFIHAVSLRRSSMSQWKGPTGMDSNKVWTARYFCGCNGFHETSNRQCILFWYGCGCGTCERNWHCKGLVGFFCCTSGHETCLWVWGWWIPMSAKGSNGYGDGIQHHDLTIEDVSANSDETSFAHARRCQARVDIAIWLWILNYFFSCDGDGYGDWCIKGCSDWMVIMFVNIMGWHDIQSSLRSVDCCSKNII